MGEGVKPPSADESSQQPAGPDSVVSGDRDGFGVGTNLRAASRNALSCLPMKILKSFLLVVVAAVAAALLAAASDSGSRPSSASSERWVPIGEKAGFVLTSEKGDTVGAELYVKTEKGWRRARIENPFTLMPIGH